jgi:hypothetical protein
MRMIRKLCLMILIAIAPASLAADVELAQRALERMSEIELNQWSYQRTLVSEDGTRIDHHDPRRAEPEHWQIVSIDGRSPTAEEIEEYNEGRETGDRKEAESKGSRDIVEMLDPGSLELQSSDDIGANYTFRLRSPNGRKEKQWNRIAGQFHVFHNDGNPFVDHVRLWNTETVYPRFGLQISEFVLFMDFAEHAEAVLPLRLEFHIGGHAWLIVRVKKSYQFHFHNFEAVKTSID